MPRVPHRLAARGSLEWEPAGHRLAILSGEALVLVDADAPDEPASFPQHRALRALAWSPDSQALALSLEGNSRLAVARVVDGAEVWNIDPGDEPDALRWSPDGAHLFAMGCPAVLCDAATGAVRWSHGRESLRSLRTYDAVRGREGVRFEAQKTWPVAASWSKDSRFVAVSWAEGHEVRDVAGRVVYSGPTTPAEGRGEALQWGPWGEPLFDDGGSRLGRCMLDTADRFARSFAFSGRLAAAEGAQHILHVRDEDGEQTQLPGHPRTITGLAWGPDGTLATACRDGLLRRLRSPRGPIEPWFDLGGWGEQLAWSADGAWLAVMTPRATWLIPA